MREKTIESRLSDFVKGRGGMCIKLTGVRGLPDRMVLLPNGRIFFIELKAPGKEPRKIQEKRLEKLRKIGFEAFYSDNFDDIMEKLRGGGSDHAF